MACSISRRIRSRRAPKLARMLSCSRLTLVFDLAQAVADGLFERDPVVTRGRLACGHQHGAFQRPRQADRLGGALAVQLAPAPLAAAARRRSSRWSLWTRARRAPPIASALADPARQRVRRGRPRARRVFAWISPSSRPVFWFRSRSGAGDGAVARILVHVGDDVLGEVEHALQVAWADVQQQPQPAGHALDIPDVSDRAGQLDVAHALAADAAVRHLDAALVADDALVANALVLAAGAFPVLLGTEDALAEQAVPLRTQRAIVDRLRLGHFTVRPVQNLLR